MEEVAILQREFSGDVTFGEKTIPLSGFWANDALFKVFSFQLLQGNPETALRAPFSILLTEKSAHKLFGDVNVLGKILALNDGRDSLENEKTREYTITGVLAEVPVFSHMKFDMLASLSSREGTETESKRLMAWDGMWDTWAYVLLPDGGDR